MVLSRAACDLTGNESCLQSSEETFLLTMIPYLAKLSIRENMFLNVKHKKIWLPLIKNEANAPRKQG